MHINSIKRERPMTHDLCKNLIVGLGGQLRRVQITKVQKSTYFAELHIMRGDVLVQIDARPSDSIAVALRLSAPIFAQESLLTSVEGEESDEADWEVPILLDGAVGQVSDIPSDANMADTTIKVGWDDWQQMAAGQLDGMTAFMMGKLKVEGDMGNAMQLQGVLAKLRS